MSILRNALSVFRLAQAEYLGEEASYASRKGDTYEILVVPGRTVFRLTNEYGVFSRTETRDFIVRPECLAAYPTKGDKIIFGPRTYEVLAPGGEPCWRWSDSLHSALRIHTKLVEEDE